MATELVDGLWHVDCRTRDRPNVYLVEDDEAWTLVDAGWPGDEGTIRQGLADAGVGPGEIERVLVTHYDADHVGTLARLTPELDAPIFVHRAEAAYVSGERLPPWTARTGLEAIHRLYYRRLSLPDLPVHTVADSDRIGGFRAHHTPGHTPGHTVFVHAGVDAAFLGDLAYAVGEELRPSGRITSYDPDQVQKSTRRLLARGLEFEYACPGHGPPLTDGDRRLSEVSERA